MALYRKTLAAFALAMIPTGALAATCPTGEDFVASCQIEGQDKEVLLCMTADQAIYRFGAPSGEPELALQSPLVDLTYLNGDKTGLADGEAVVFHNQDTSYRVVFGFRRSATDDWVKTGSITVLRGEKAIAELTCAEDTVARLPERLAGRMKDLGRTTLSDGQPLVLQSDRRPAPADQSPPCEQYFNVDTCWQRGLAAANLGDPALALGHFDMSCDAGFNTSGCYDAGKLFLQNRDLRDYDRAYNRLSLVCDGDDIGFAPFACKYLGWMHQTGIGADKDAAQAWDLLRRACFPTSSNGMAPVIDAEGCHFLAKAAQISYPPSVAPGQTGAHIAYLALAMGCADGAFGICEEANTFLEAEIAASALWIAECDSFGSCASLIEPAEGYEEQRALMEEITHQYGAVLRYLP